MLERMIRLAPPGLGSRLEAELARLQHPELDDTLVRTAGWHEWAERAARRAGLGELAHRIDRRGNQRFAESVIEWLSREPIDAVWGFDGCSAEVFASPAARSTYRILDRTIADWREWNALLAQIAERHGDWLAATDRPVSPETIARNDAEYDAADAILCGSPHVAASLARHSPVPGIAPKTSLLPYCYDGNLFAPAPAIAAPATDAPMRLLFVGQIGVRKGAHLLLEALADIPASEASLTMVGAMQLPPRMVARHADRFTHIPSLPRTQIPGIMQRHDVLVLPSYFEGSAIVLLEALASGLAVIQTRAAGLGATERSGIVLDKPDTDALREAILSLVHDRARLQSLRKAAPDDARRYSFDNYCAGIAALLAETLA
ncbi:glycosyltransferase [Altererythrobacter aurantiacus]|uniref:Glycosyltransferase n=2 Tax=Parapontixanthobacter aurantiacus TaxID=1463599 RepID=A0A844ZDQ1_9SPHN|nr:glycosyltransferase [Parapontixanthobacter aurantiacus]